MRGIMYHITADPMCIGDMCSNDFNTETDLALLSADGVYDRDANDAATDTAKLKQKLEAAGFIIIPDTPDENVDRELAAFVLETSSELELEAAQCRFFQPMLAALQKKVMEMPLKTFSTEPAALYSLSSLIDDDHDGAVYLDLGTGPQTYTLHGFVRRLRPNTKYFIAPNTVLMH